MVHTMVNSAATTGITQITSHMPHTSRTDFNQTWLTEMPEGLGGIELWDMMLYNIQDQIRHGAQVIAVNANLKKITESQTVYYWWEVAGEMVLAAEFSVRPQAYTVNAVAKSPPWRRKPPYVTDLYQAVLADTGQSIRLFSDTQLSNAGMVVWRKPLAARSVCMTGIILVVHSSPSVTLINWNNTSRTMILTTADISMC